MRLVDLSHTVEDGMTTYPGLPAPIICDFLSREASQKHYAEGVSFHIGKIELVANTGTYIDSPFHRYAHGKDLSELDLDSVAELSGICIDARNAGRALTPDLLEGLDVMDKAVLFHTGWATHWRTPEYMHGHPFLTAATADALTDAGAKLAGIDSLNIDDTSGGERPVHSTLLGADIPIVEHMCNLDLLPSKDFKFHAVPVKIKGFGTFPVRAFAVV